MHLISRIIKDVPEQSTNSNVAEQLVGSKLASFDTPPPTPDSTPMSIGNSPNFKHQPRMINDKQQTFPAATKNVSNLSEMCRLIYSLYHHRYCMT